MNNDLISREALKEEIEKSETPEGYKLYANRLIDNAPTVEIDLVKVAEEHEKIGFKKGFNEGYAQAQVDLERPLLENWADGCSYIEIPTTDAIRAIKNMGEGGAENEHL